MKFIKFIKSLFQCDDKYEGVWPIKIYVMKLFFALMFLFIPKEAWGVLITHQGTWDPLHAIAWCAMASYTTLAGLGIFHTLKMLPIMLFMLMYKGLWLLFVAYPLWSTGQLAGSEAEGWVSVFVPIIVPFIFMPWCYVFKTYVYDYKK